uniref:Uracil phosphoribosyltransferase homolog n=1 Tax=Phallusia mammillata TaxID=59560 RepID=A0A6F9DXD0_9ASCI|nr:uracil phosphoribosyltransferase homolog [Phallusia mammillata]
MPSAMVTANMATNEPEVRSNLQTEIDNSPVFYDDNPPQLRLVAVNDQIRRLQTILRDKNSTRSEFVFSADRLIRIVIEESLNLLPYSSKIVQTSCGHPYEGIKFDKGNCGVSIIRSGEAMEQGLRDCCRSIRLGKILIQTDDETNQAKVFYAKLPKDIHRRNVLLMYPILSSGNTAIKAIEILEDHNVPQSSIILLTLFTTPEGLNSVITNHPKVRILSTEVYPVAPVHFGQKYFGTD